MRWAGALLLLAAVAGSFAYLDLRLGELLTLEGMAQMRAYAASFFPPDLSGGYLERVWRGSLETLSLSAVGTLLAAGLGLLLALPAAGRLGLAARLASRLTLNGLRSIPELVWAAIMVLAAGLGPFAGALALAAHTGGVLGRLFAETLENAPPEPTQALRLSGSPALSAFFYGTLPNVIAQFAAYTLYRWEINIRMAAIVGFVGAGGLGQMLYVSLSLFQQPQACTVILAMLALVMMVDAVSFLVRRQLAAAGR